MKHRFGRARKHPNPSWVRDDLHVHDQPDPISPGDAGLVRHWTLTQSPLSVHRASDRRARRPSRQDAGHRGVTRRPRDPLSPRVLATWLARCSRAATDFSPAYRLDPLPSASVR